MPPSTSQYSLPSCQRGSAWALPEPTGLCCPHGAHVLPPSVVRSRFGLGRALLFASATTAVVLSKTQPVAKPLPTSVNDLPPSREESSRPPASCFSASTNFISGSVQSTAHQSTWPDLPSSFFQVLPWSGLM